jgi:hypothetical protein
MGWQTCQERPKPAEKTEDCGTRCGKKTTTYNCTKTDTTAQWTATTSPVCQENNDACPKGSANCNASCQCNTGYSWNGSKCACSYDINHWTKDDCIIMDGTWDEDICYCDIPIRCSITAMSDVTPRVTTSIYTGNLFPIGGYSDNCDYDFFGKYSVPQTATQTSTCTDIVAEKSGATAATEYTKVCEDRAGFALECKSNIFSNFFTGIGSYINNNMPIGTLKSAISNNGYKEIGSEDCSSACLENAYNVGVSAQTLPQKYYYMDLYIGAGNNTLTGNGIKKLSICKCTAIAYKAKQYTIRCQ